MRTDTPKTIYLKDYTAFPFKIENVHLDFDIHDGHTIVTATTIYQRTDTPASTIYLHGEDLEILNISIDGKTNDTYTKTDDSLTLNIPDNEKFTLEIQTKIYPEKNTRLEGLYNSGGTYCTQCEAEGFRRITYYPDRPDVMTEFTVRIEADKKYPVLLSNGNRIDGGESGEDRHFNIWEDPHPKPCYLFALVVGDLTHIHDTFTTASGREVDLYIYVRHGDEDQCAHAMESLKRSMIWDEEVYGLEYDLNIFNIVAVSDFNMGAMENKSLNIFNTALVLAQQETATDQDFMRVEGVIAHEYFHNWSGNRVTCRDWFQLSLKEGLTVFRDQEFSSDMHSRDVQRIDDVTHLRRFQFSEDSSPLAHPIRPDNYIEINNFYTMTVYEKGAEIIRMIRTMLGVDNYRKGTDLYFERHDGQAVTCDDFTTAMEDASGVDLTQFKLWYSQAGTPELTFTGAYNKTAQTYNITLKQHVPDTAGQSDKKPMPIPCSIGLIGAKGQDLIETTTLILSKTEQTFTIENITEKPTPSILRNFSAPVKLTTDLTDDDLAFLMIHDTDGFNRWEAGQTYYLRTINEIISTGKQPSDAFLNVYGDLLERTLHPDSDKALMARAISMPDIQSISQGQDIIDPQAIHIARESVLNAVSTNFKGLLKNIYIENRTSDVFSISAEAMGQRTLQNTAMMILSNGLTNADAQRCKTHYDLANNMTDRMAALYLACALDGAVHDNIVGDFYNRYKEYPLVIDKWFSAQAQIHLPKTIDIVHKLLKHDDFNITNPNRVRSLFSAFAMNNPVRFHATDGSGYTFLCDAIIELNQINPQIAARLLTPMRTWRSYTPDRQKMMKQVLSDILDIEDIAPDIFEIASKSLND
ncbi:MAG: aminopeptidase N [Zetaproteobacteria bacterium]|nr:MAG: aminopeptidase N [Zetaproteobacteria bacterium]